MTDPERGVREARVPYGSEPDDVHPARAPRAYDPTVGLIGRTETMVALRRAIDRFGPTVATVLIHGETGTGKELVARALHARSKRAARPFVAANVAALPATMLASELFGHERGAFTGACFRHKGLFEQATGGTLFLDEIGELDPEAQASLLRVLETREVRPVGAERPRPVDVRLLIATHRDLARMIRQGAFREDLFYRLHQLVVEVPALRYRTPDIPLLARHLLTRLDPDEQPRELDPDANRALQDYAWPGNVRQLENVLRRAAITSEERVLTRHQIERALRHEQDGSSLGHEAATTATVLTLLAAENGNISRTARRLGIARSTVRAHLRRAGQRTAA